MEKIDIQALAVTPTVQIMSEDGLSTVGIRSGLAVNNEIIAAKINEIIDFLSSHYK